MYRTATSMLILACFWLGAILACGKFQTRDHSADNVPESTNRNAATPAATPSTPVVESNNNKATESDQLHTPPANTPERQSIMDGLRVEFKKQTGIDGHPYRGEIIFVVNYLQVHNGWAWAFVEPQSSDPRDQFGENSGFLLHLENQHWSAMNLPPPIDDPDDPENLGYPSGKDLANIKKMYPAVAPDIFPKH